MSCRCSVLTPEIVSLFVRLWVEIFLLPLRRASASSASSWGCELKYYNKLEGGVPIGQPLREAVSWNDTQGSLSDRPCSVSLFVRLWVEITKRRKSKKEVSRQPLREAVSWNGYDGWVYTKSISQPLREAVSWNIIAMATPCVTAVSLFVRLWVEIYCNNL